MVVPERPVPVYQPRLPFYRTRSTPADPTYRKSVDRKTDCVLSYSHRDPDISALYKSLDDANNRYIGHTVDTFTKRTVLFSGFEIKPVSGNHTEAVLQMSIWVAASSCKKQELARSAQVSFDPVAIVEPGLTVVGHEHAIYYAYLCENIVSGKSGVHVLGPDVDRFERLSADSIRGIFRLIRMYGNVLEYGMDERNDGYWGGFLKPILYQLAGIA